MPPVASLVPQTPLAGPHARMPSAQTPLLSPAGPPDAMSPAGAWTQAGRITRQAAYAFGATFGLGAAGAYTAARLSGSHTPLVLGLPAAAVTALGVTSWRLGHMPDGMDLEQGDRAPQAGPVLPVVLPVGTAEQAAVYVPVGGSIVYLSAPPAPLQAASGAASSKRPRPRPRRVRPAAYARSRGVVHRLPCERGSSAASPRALEPSPHSPRPKSPLARRLQTPEMPPLQPSLRASAVKGPMAVGCADPFLSAASERDWLLARTSMPRQAPMTGAAFSQSLPTQLSDSRESCETWLWHSDVAGHTLQSAAALAPDVACAPSDADSDGLIMPRPSFEFAARDACIEAASSSEGGSGSVSLKSVSVSESALTPPPSATPPSA